MVPFTYSTQVTFAVESHEDGEHCGGRGRKGAPGQVLRCHIILFLDLGVSYVVCSLCEIDSAVHLIFCPYLFMLFFHRMFKNIKLTKDLIK